MVQANKPNSQSVRKTRRGKILWDYSNCWSSCEHGHFPFLLLLCAMLSESEKTLVICFLTLHTHTHAHTHVFRKKCKCSWTDEWSQGQGRGERALQRGLPNRPSWIEGNASLDWVFRLSVEWKNTHLFSVLAHKNGLRATHGEKNGPLCGLKFCGF